MQIKIKGKVIYTCSVQRLVYTLCFFLFCVIDQRSKTVYGLYVFRDLIGVVMAVIILTHYHLEDFRKWKVLHLIWTAIWMISVPIVFALGGYVTAYPNLRMEWWAITLGVVLFGYILINTFCSAVLGKKRPKMNLKYGAVWLMMMVLMIVSRSTYQWPFTYLVMFSCFYLTNYSQEEKKDLFQGMLDGIILGFFVFQGFCFVFRPYDVVRYRGVYDNSNSNALFYVIVLAAVLAKILYTVKNQSNKRISLYYWVGAGAVLSFELLTIGRMGWLTAIFLVIAFLSFLAKLPLHRKWWKNLLMLILCVCLTFPLCFSAVRYLPSLFPLPIRFPEENKNRESQVNSRDPWNSEKYIELDEYVEAAVGRIIRSFEDVLEHSPFVWKEDAEEANPVDSQPVLTLQEGENTIAVRSAIYKYYLNRLNFWGHPNEEYGFYLTPTFYVFHAHDIYLQYGTDFGIPVMILFMVLIFWGARLLSRQYKQQKSETAAGCWMFLLIPAVFGLFEYPGETGNLSIILMFVAWREVICGEEKQVN